MAKPKGIAVNFRSDQTGFPASAETIELLGDSVYTVVSTVPGERVKRPTFGCWVKRLIFANLNRATALRARSEVKRAIAAWEPRVEVVDVLYERTGETRFNLHIVWKPLGAESTQTTLVPVEASQ